GHSAISAIARKRLYSSGGLIMTIFVKPKNDDCMVKLENIKIETEIKHPPIKCPACGCVNHEGAIAISIENHDNLLSSILDINNNKENINFIFDCQQCPEFMPLKRTKLRDKIFWEIPWA